MNKSLHLMNDDPDENRFHFDQIIITISLRLCLRRHFACDYFSEFFFFLCCAFRVVLSNRTRPTALAHETGTPVIRPRCAQTRNRQTVASPAEARPHRKIECVESPAPIPDGNDDGGPTKSRVSDENHKLLHVTSCNDPVRATLIVIVPTQMIKIRRRGGGVTDQRSIGIIKTKKRTNKEMTVFRQNPSVHLSRFRVFSFTRLKKINSLSPLPIHLP